MIDAYLEMDDNSDYFLNVHVENKIISIQKSFLNKLNSLTQNDALYKFIVMQLQQEFISEETDALIVCDSLDISVFELNALNDNFDECRDLEIDLMNEGF